MKMAGRKLQIQLLGEMLHTKLVLTLTVLETVIQKNRELLNFIHKFGIEA